MATPEKCDHPNVIREVCGMQKSGDHVCTSCGETFTPEEMKERREAAGKRPPELRPSRKVVKTWRCGLRLKLWVR
jgi:methionyl-tRNA synthetase